MEIVYSNQHFIRPAAKHILTIGKGIVKDNITAVAELVKNSYDADASKVEITFQRITPLKRIEELKKELSSLFPHFDENIVEEISTRLLAINDSEDPYLIANSNLLKVWLDSRPKYKIIINDDGHGMDLDTILNKWLVPSTDNKVKNRKSKSKRRTVLGRKGIGRYASSILGDELTIETTYIENQEKTVIVLDWKEFENEKYQFLDEVPILIETFKPSDTPPGTCLQILSYFDWSQKTRKNSSGQIETDIDEIIYYLRKLISPLSTKEDKFQIKLKFENFFPRGENINEIFIEPFPIIETFHFRIKGRVELDKNNLIASYKIKNNYEPLSPEISQTMILYDIPIERYCGKIDFDLKVFDQDDRSIEAIKSQSNQFVVLKNNDIRKMLDENAGIGIFRDKFRIRPYGDKKNDWLELNARRINQPTRKLGNNQIMGIVQIEDELQSGLIEKATREGLKENEKYEGLKAILLILIQVIEEERNRYRDHSGKRQKDELPSHEQLNKVLDITGLYTKIEGELKKAQVSLEVINKIATVVQDERETKQKQAIQIGQNLIKKEEDFKEAIAVYQLQATLGKILNVVLHEGRKPLSYLKLQPKNIIAWSNRLNNILIKDLHIDNKSVLDLSEKILNRATDIQFQSESILRLFSKLDSLSSTKRSKRKEFSILKSLKQSFDIFENEIEDSGIKYNIETQDDVLFLGWETDFISAFTNLIENSIYWLNISKKPNKSIKVSIVETTKFITIIFFDNGIGIPEDLISKKKIFTTGFSTKPGGTGLGLSIIGESLERNHGKFGAVYNPNGAEFNIVIDKISGSYFKDEENED